MAKKHKKRKFHLSIGVIIRWLIFAFLFYLAIGYLSVNHFNSKSKLKLDLPSATTSAIISEADTQNLQQKFIYYQDQAIIYIEKQLAEIKKGLVTKIYDDIINSIDKKNEATGTAN